MKSHQKHPHQGFHYATTDICLGIIGQIVERSISQSQSAMFYKMEIERCQEYISRVQAQATRVWEPPSKPEELENMEDVQFFQSSFCLKHKLTHLQEDRQRTESIGKHITSEMPRSNTIRGSLKSRASSMSVFSWSQQKYNTLKQNKQNKLKQKNRGRQFSLQKLAVTRKDLITRTEKELREKIETKVEDNQKSKKRTYRRMFLRKREGQVNNEDDGTMPMLIELAYNVSHEFKNKSLTKKECLPKLLDKKPRLSTATTNKNKQRLVIGDHNKDQIKVNNWRRLNELNEAKTNEPHTIPKEFTDINYFTEEATA